MKATGQYFPVVLLIMLYKVTICNFQVCGETLSVTIQLNYIKQYFPVVLYSMSYKVDLAFLPFKRKHSSTTFLWYC